ncbi:MAG TPA: hypothetical protein VGJ07_14265, partial [Rugosimonospora sp.]
LLVDSHGNPLRSVEVRSAGGPWHALDRADYNYWLASSGLGTGPFSVRVTDVYGNRATASGIRMAPTALQQTQVWMYGHSPAAPSAAASHWSAPASPSLSVSPAATPSPTPTGTAALPAGLAPVRSADCGRGGTPPSRAGQQAPRRAQPGPIAVEPGRTAGGHPCPAGEARSGTPRPSILRRPRRRPGRARRRWR